MSLLSGLLNNLLPILPLTSKPSMPNRTTDHQHMKLVESTTQLGTSLYTNAANATPEWRQARDRYINHVMACRSCHAPLERYCTMGAGLREAYDQTPMEHPVESPPQKRDSVQ